MASRAAPRSALSFLARRTRFAPSTGMTPTKAALAVPSRQMHTRLRTAPIASAQSRPRISSRATPVLPGSLATGARTIFIQTESTPNADAVKFVPNHRVIPETVGAPFIEYLTPRSTISAPYPSPLAANLMNIEGVNSVFYGSDFITVTKDPETNWAHIRPEVFALITEAITSGQEVVSAQEAREGHEGPPVEEDTLAYDENDSEVVGMIKELLETRIRPSIQEDGGDIDYMGFEGGFVQLKLRGACRTCDSSTVTLKNGIEGMLMHYIEEVKGVHQVLDPAEEVAVAEFAKFEEKLKQQRQNETGTSADAAAP